MNQSLKLDEEEKQNLLAGSGHGVYIYLENCLQAVVRPTIAPKLDRIADDVEAIFQDSGRRINERVLDFAVLLSKYSTSRRVPVSEAWKEGLVQ
jgi:hypothetical protein